ncbi:hypothetical protein Cni_G06729 [Canna indica]|uniref:C3HC-type domain-containing protein n=1 Tax=Canna indica TaxID=4628 RepID=A0AAQ3K0U7_9LILI|nr:hypothetical protein Cni_G06729 [Canna indica]
MTAGDPEQRLQMVMDKLYHAPNSRPSLPSVKRMESGAAGSFDKGTRVPSVAAASVRSIGEAPPCRPWDRGDLMRRLATFKAMTWFGKPKAISPVNCARRGWINVEMDVIACEACGARLLFSTPSSWPFQQVEKAAAVFSLKLDNGHKLLCPWIDNACDEALALFPPTTPQALVEGYRERSVALLKLSALPMISPSAIDYMKTKSPLIEHYLSEASHYPINLSNDIKIVDGSICKDMDGGSETVADDVFYQVLKLICLCGWEPRLLPYVVDCEDPSNALRESAPTSKSDVTSSSLHLHPELKDGLTIYSSGIGKPDSIESANPNIANDAYDPASAVLDCKFCGACVALWGFSTVQQPLELYTLVAGSSNQNEPTNPGVKISKSEALRTVDLVLGTSQTIQGDSSREGSLKEKSLGLNLTIAGGPPATKQNFQPRVSFPIVSRHFRTELISSGNSISHEESCENQVSRECLPVEEDPLHSQNDMNGARVVSHGQDSLKRKRNEKVTLSEFTDSKGDTHDARTSGIINSSADGEGIIQQDCNIENQEVDAQNAEILPGAKDSVEKGEASNEKVDGSGETANTKTNVTHSDVNHSESVTEPADNCSKSNDDISRLEPIHHGAVSKDSGESNTFASADVVLTSDSRADTGKCEKDSNVRTKINNQNSDRLEVMVSLYANHEDTKDTFGKRSTRTHYNRTSQFDPIRQHRPYCPWVAPDDGEAMPGWKLTLSAVVHHEKDSSTPTSAKTSSSFLDDMDDPLVSVRKLFASPQKRLRGTR